VTVILVEKNEQNQAILRKQENPFVWCVCANGEGSDCIEEAECEGISYYEDHIECSNADEVEKRNRHKSEIMYKLCSTGKVRDVHYRVFFNSCNLEHVLYNESKNFSDEFAEKYEGRVQDFIDYISDVSVAVPGTYKATWRYIEKDKNSLHRHSNMHLIFE